MFTNTRQRTSGWLIWALVASLAILAVISFTAPPVAATRKHSEHQKIHPLFRRITWTPPAVSTTIAPGQSQTFSLSLTVPRPFRDVGVHVSRGLRPFVHVEPATFERIGTDQTVKITLTIFVPQTAVRGRVEGKLRLFRRPGFGRKGKTIAIPLLLARPLPVVIDIKRTAPVVTITEPADGATVPEDSVLVRGTVYAGGAEVGVSVNGVPAFITGTEWAAQIPLVAGSNGISATATTATGAQATTAITVQVTQPQEALVALTASPVSGLAPLTVRFEVESGLERPIIRYEFEQNGDGTPDLTSATFENVEVTYTDAGIIVPTLTVVDDRGETVTATTIIQVLDQADTIALFQAKWEALKAALAARDIPRATAEFAFGVRPRFEQVLRALDANLPSIAPTLGTVAITRVTDGLAEGVTQRVQGGKTYLYFIYWAPDVDGIWRIIEM
jgi:hypothetical protein